MVSTTDHERVITLYPGRYPLKISCYDTVIGDESEAETVLLLHGLTTSKRTLATTVISEFEKLAIKTGRSVRLIAPDWPGHGLSQDAQKHSLSLSREILAGITEEFNLDRVHLFGMSLGGVAAVLFAARYPERVLTITEQGAPVRLRKRFVRLLARAKSPVYFRAHDVARLRSQKGVRENAARDLRRVSKRAVFEYLHDIFRTDLREALDILAESDIPFCIMDGDRVEHPDLDSISVISLFVPRAKQVRIPGTGHIASLIRPDVVAETLLEMTDPAEYKLLKHSS